MARGGWGTALATVAARAGRDVILWGRDRDGLAAITAGENRRYLPGVALPQIAVTTALDAIRHADAVLLCVPAQTTRVILANVAPLLKPGTPMLLCAKGIEQRSGKLLPEVLREAAPALAPAILSGPSFARDVALGLPTAVTIAADANVGAGLQESFSTPSFRPYASDDITGVALGGATKNVYAIACGVVEGLGLGENARAALLARSFAELARFGEALGARRETLMGLSGLGDLVLSATSRTSRNFSYGVELARADAHISGKLAEGVATAPALVARARTLDVELPIAEAVADLISGALPLSDAVARLMNRKLKAE